MTTAIEKANALWAKAEERREHDRQAEAEQRADAKRARQALMRNIEHDAPDVARFLTEAQRLFGRPAECHLTLPGLNGGVRTRVR